MTRFHWYPLLRPILFIQLGLLGAPAVHAQTDPPSLGTPVISRLCLWNADRDTWHALGLRRDQVRRLEALRVKYPAVVNGQWGKDPDALAAPAPQLGSLGPIAPGVLIPLPAGLKGSGSDASASTPASAQPITGLQTELRAVLTPKQLRAWGERCGGN